MQALIESVIDSYELRVKMVGDLIRQAAEALKDFHIEQENLASELKNLLTKTESLRKKDFDKMMEKIWSRRKKKREEEITQMIEKFQMEEKRILRELRKILDPSKPVRIDDLEVIKEEIMTRCKDREREVSNMLKKFHLEQEELCSALKKLLSKGERVRVKDLKAMIQEIQIQWIYREGEMGRLFEELEKVRDEMIDPVWQRVIQLALP